MLYIVRCCTRGCTIAARPEMVPYHDVENHTWRCPSCRRRRRERRRGVAA